MKSMIIQKHILQDLSNPRSHYNPSQSTKLIIIIQNTYKNHVIVSRTHEHIERMIALLMLTQSSCSFMSLVVIIRHYNHRNFSDVLLMTPTPSHSPSHTHIFPSPSPPHAHTHLLTLTCSHSSTHTHMLTLILSPPPPHPHPLTHTPSLTPPHPHIMTKSEGEWMREW
jgi:hypothetical protein